MQAELTEFRVCPSRNTSLLILGGFFLYLMSSSQESMQFMQSQLMQRAASDRASASGYNSPAGVTGGASGACLCGTARVRFLFHSSAANDELPDCIKEAIEREDRAACAIPTIRTAPSVAPNKKPSLTVKACSAFQLCRSPKSRRPACSE
jgi:hypothetical protein